MEHHVLTKTTNGSVVGMMNEFAVLADALCDQEGEADLLGLSLRLTDTPCGPLYRRHVRPDRELVAWLRESTGGDGG